MQIVDFTAVYASSYNCDGVNAVPSSEMALFVKVAIFMILLLLLGSFLYVSVKRPKLKSIRVILLALVSLYAVGLIFNSEFLEFPWLCIPVEVQLDVMKGEPGITVIPTPRSAFLFDMHLEQGEYSPQTYIVRLGNETDAIVGGPFEKVIAIDNDGRGRIVFPNTGMKFWDNKVFTIFSNETAIYEANVHIRYVAPPGYTIVG